MTEKLFYEDQYLTSFPAQVVKQTTDKADRLYVVLNQTAFYPTGGGQPFDKGMLNEVAVTDVEEVNAELRHFVEREVEEEVQGEINWMRRFDHMQQHAGQHILSAAFEDRFGYKTVSFHLGQEVCTIDLDISSLDEAEVRNVEAFANSIVQNNHPIETKWVTNEEVTQYNLRKEVSVTDHIRLVLIPDIDTSGCGGTHPSSTAEVGAISILKWEKQKKQLRVHFVCGNRVLDQLHQKQKVVQGLTNGLNVPQGDLVDAANRLVMQTKEHEKMIDELNDRLLTFEAKELLQSAGTIHEQRVVQMISYDYGMKEIQKLGKTILNEDPSVVVFLISEVENKLQIVCGRGADLHLDMNLALKEVLPLINGKGGGKKEFAQGGGDAIRSSEEILIELVKVSLQ
ncbi:alanyl-tRNA editing protein [Guptibacillus hwajinpoensis]|uniref:Alanyl-tRNA synthetase n=1 Tax=Guptibacillus hwajinpoensis TaxID=208199 RepID=A0ABU0K2S6_9BACL|nr:DHHA1 domain-containing protein [Alkalihalobacillus hemicentroti]MDQ0483662.1 alanyl-tRNA synthetase [Alkalihalobacillus hemicentroti]